MSEVPNAEVTVSSGGGALINSGSARNHVVIGYASAGSLTVMNQVDNTTLVDTYVSGDAVKEAARAIDKVSAPCFFLRRNYTPTASAKTTTSTIAGTALATVSGTPLEALEYVFAVTTGGAVSSGAVAYTLSLDNGATEIAGTLASTGILSLGGGLTLTFDPPANELVALATELRADFLAHFANAVAHNSADATAAAIVSLGAPATNAASLAVINQCRLALISHLGNNTAHDSFDVVDLPALGASATLQEARLLAIELKTVYNLHRVATFVAAPAGLLIATASVAAPVTILAAALISGGLSQLADYPAQITFTTAGVTPSDAPATVTVVGLDENGDPQTMTAYALAQTAATVTTAESWSAITSIDYPAADGTSATVSIGIAASAHNSADVTNVVTTASPSSGTLVTNDEVLVSTTDPSPAICSLLKAGGGTLTVTASGTPVETVYARIEFLTAGVIGVDGITYRVSLDNGKTWQPIASLGVDTTIVVNDRRLDGTTTTTGVTLTLVATETVAVDTVVTFRTTSPRVAIADVLTGIDIAVNSQYKQRGWRFMSIVGEYTASEMAQIQTRLNTIQSSKKQWFYTMASFRDKRPYEADLSWTTEVALDRATLNADRVAPCAGYGRGFTCPITGRLDRRRAQLADVVRRLCVDENVESGQKNNGPIGSEIAGTIGGETAAGDVTLYENGERVEYDADVDSSLADARITVLRAFANGGLGAFINGSRLGTGTASRFTRTRDREVNDLVSRAAYAKAVSELLNNIRRNPGTYPVGIPAQAGDPGTPLEADALTFKDEMETAIKGAVGRKASSIVVNFDKTVNLTGVLGNTPTPREIKWTVDVEGIPVVEQAAVQQNFLG